jgi:mannose-6-phosphate isomerase-like protein (cupin superfamily)
VKDIDRRSVLKAIAGFSFAPGLSQTQRGLGIRLVRAGGDRTGQAHKAARADSRLDFKVLTAETRGALFIMENRDMVRGGPPKHVHYMQEEWFFLIEGGEVAVEIGDQKLRLKPGDSVLAPRNVPHVWAYLGDRPGRMLFAFTPAGEIEDFFIQTSKSDATVGDQRLFEAHGMKVVGPPLVV